MENELERAAEEINGRGRAVTEARPHVPTTMGEQCAESIRNAAETVCRAIVTQGEEQVAVAQSHMEAAKALLDHAKDVASNIRKEAEKRAQQAIEIDRRMVETGTMLHEINSKSTDHVDLTNLELN